MDDDQPVTRREFREVTEQLQSSINDTREEANDRFNRVEEKQDKMWDALLRIEAMIKRLQDIPARVARLERDRGI